jgi:hypothetical protein
MSFYCYFSIFFLDLIIQHWMNWESGFVIIFFFLLYMGLSRFYDSGRKLDRLTWVFLFFFCWCFFQFYYSILDQLGIVLHIFFVCIIWDYLGFTTQITNFVSWLVWFLCHFFNFIIQHWVNWQLSFIFCFELHSLVLGWLRIRFNNFFICFFLSYQIFMTWVAALTGSSS